MRSVCVCVRARARARVCRVRERDVVMQPTSRFPWHKNDHLVQNPPEIQRQSLLLHQALWAALHILTGQLVSQSKRVSECGRMASNMFLYWGSGSVPCWRAMLVLEEKGLQGYGNKLLSFSQKEHKGEEVLKLNPRGQVRVTRPVQSEAVIYVRSLPKFGGGERVGWGCRRGSCCLRSVKVRVQAGHWAKRMLYVIVRPCFCPDRQQAGLTLSQSSGEKKLHYHRGSATF